MNSGPPCGYWSDCKIIGGGCCALNLFGGQPGIGTCYIRCEKNPDRGKSPPIVPLTVSAKTPTPEEQAQAKAKRDAVTHALWLELHTRAAKLKNIDAAAEEKWLIEWAKRVPCGDCQKHRTDWWEAHPPDLSSPAAYFAWGVDFHDGVNLRLGKATMELDLAKKLYGVD